MTRRCVRLHGSSLKHAAHRFFGDSRYPCQCGCWTAPTCIGIGYGTNTCAMALSKHRSEDTASLGIFSLMARARARKAQGNLPYRRPTGAISRSRRAGIMVLRLASLRLSRRRSRLKLTMTCRCASQRISLESIGPVRHTRVRQEKQAAATEEASLASSLASSRMRPPFRFRHHILRDSKFRIPAFPVSHRCLLARLHRCLHHLARLLARRLFWTCRHQLSHRLPQRISLSSTTTHRISCSNKLWKACRPKDCQIHKDGAPTSGKDWPASTPLSTVPLGEMRRDAGRTAARC